MAKKKKRMLKLGQLVDITHHSGPSPPRTHRTIQERSGCPTTRSKSRQDVASVTSWGATDTSNALRVNAVLTVDCKSATPTARVIPPPRLIAPRHPESEVTPGGPDS